MGRKLKVKDWLAADGEVGGCFLKGTREGRVEGKEVGLEPPAAREDEGCVLNGKNFRYRLY